MTKSIWILGLLLMLAVTGCREDQIIQFPQTPEKRIGERSPLPASASTSTTENAVATGALTEDVGALAGSLSSYTGQNGYGRQYPDFVVHYSPALWNLVLDDASRNDRLESTQIPSCTLHLNMGGMGSPAILQKQIGPYQWHVGSLNDPRAFLYWTQVSDTLYFFFGLALPDIESTERSQHCMSMAEEVMGTATFIPQ
jgi:hypothetical protein